MTEYSHSRLSSFENCARQFKYHYLDGIAVETEGVEAFVGHRVHEILERLYHHVSRHRRPPSLVQVLERFRKDWVQHYHDGIVIVRTENPPEHYHRLGERCLENYYRRHYPFDEGETVAIEEPLHATLDSDGAYLWRGVVDRIVRRAPGHYEIHDYKTSGYLPPLHRFDTDRQLALYQIGLEHSYADVEGVDLVWHYLAHNKTIRSRRSPDQLDELRTDVIALIDRVEAEEEFAPSPGPLCRWCDYNDICEAAAVPRQAEPEPTAPGQPGPERDRLAAGARALGSRAAHGFQLSLL